MNIRNNVNWQGEGWYVVTTQDTTRMIEPHSTDFHKSPNEEFWWRKPLEGISYQYLEDRPGPYTASEYFKRKRIVALPLYDV